jgi:transcriptional regulator GlxA family with amidase domain
MATSIAIFIFDGAEELDWVGPWEVLAAWAKFWPEEASVFTVSRGPGPVQCAKGMKAEADHTWDTAPPFDVLVYPGGEGTRAHLGDEEIRKWLSQAVDSNALMTSVCTGSLVYADAGLLNGRPATTHWASLDFLASLGEGIDVRKDERFVDDGQIITAAGVSAGIDMALHLIDRLHSNERAKEVRRYIQYDPDPPV